MKRQVCAVRDAASKLFGQPMFVPTIGVAVRSFGDECKRKDVENPLNAHPEHFELFHLGSFDEETGKFECFEPKSIGLASDYV